MALAGIVITLLGASEVSLAVIPGAPCVTQPRLVSRLESAGLRVVDGTSQRLAVTVRHEPGGLMVRAVRQGAAFERTVPAQRDECGAVERVVAALIASWSLQLPAPEAPEPKRAARSIAVAVVTAEPIVEPAAPVEEQTPPPAAPPPDRKPLAIAVEETPRLEVAIEPPVKPAETLFELDLAALGGGSLGPTPSVAGVGQLHLGLSLGRFGLLLEGGLQSARSSSEIDSMRIESSTQWLSLSTRVSLQPAPRLRFDFGLGFRLWRIAAQSFNTVNPRAVELFPAGAVASVGATVRLAGPLSLVARVFTSVRSNYPRFFIDGLGPVLALQPWEGGLLLGLEVRLFGGE